MIAQTVRLLIVAIALGTAAFAQDTTVVIRSFKFMAMDVSVHPGASVTWVNQDEEPHTVTSETGLFKSGGLDTGDKFTFKFDKPGIYKYRCSLHAQMVGTITVK